MGNNWPRVRRSALTRTHGNRDRPAKAFRPRCGRLARVAPAQMAVFPRFAARTGLPDDATALLVITAVQAITYGRPALRTPQGVLAEWTGTCSTKHALLAQLLTERWPQLRPRLVHRVYRADRAAVLGRHGAAAAAAVPPGGLIDVHRYLIITVDGQQLPIDVTFPGDPPWDGRQP